jgi:hypothetical protein
MSFEFGVPDWLKARPVLYLVSHMAIMPLIDLLLTGIEWVPGGGAASGLWMFLALSFVNGCVLEIGRKLWAPENEIAGVDTYSGLWGPQRAAMIWSVTVILSLALLLGVGRATDTFLVALILGGTIGALEPFECREIRQGTHARRAGPHGSYGGPLGLRVLRHRGLRARSHEAHLMLQIIAQNDASDVEAVGGKAASLARLSAHGFNPPAFFVIRAEAFEAEGPVPGLDDAIAGLGSGPFAVRSSARAEDGADHSHAGQFDTFLNVAAKDVGRPQKGSGARAFPKRSRPTAR